MKKMLFIFIFFLINYSFAQNTLPVNLWIPTTLVQNAFELKANQLPQDQALLSPAQVKANKTKYLKRYFYAWDQSVPADKFCVTANNQHCINIPKLEQQTVDGLMKNPGLDKNYQPHNKAWIESIKKNMQMSHFPVSPCKGNEGCKAIIISNAFLRGVPTDDPSFSDISEPGQAYPFDNLEYSAIWAGTPVNVLQVTRDKKWYLVTGDGFLGWTHANQVGFVDAKFIKNWEHYPLITATSLVSTINLSPNEKKPYRIYLGSLFPEIKTQSLSNHSQLYQILIPQIGKQHQAVAKKEWITSNNFFTWPLKTTPYNFNRMINQILTMPYGWGDDNFDTDCSATMKRLLGAFGIWLPRSSGTQAYLGGYINPMPSSKFSAALRKSIVLGDKTVKDIQKPIPYLTLISYGSQDQSVGHISMFLGVVPQKHPKYAVIFQSVWGLHLLDLYQKDVGRLIYARAVVSPISGGKQFDLKQYGLTVQDLWQKKGFNLTFLNRGANQKVLKNTEKKFYE